MENSSSTGAGGSGSGAAKFVPPADYGVLDTSEAETNQFWMAHIAPRLASVWNDAPEGTVLGRLTFTKGTGEKLVLNKNVRNNSNNLRGRNNNDGSRHTMTVEVDPALTAAHPDLPPRYTVENLTKRLPGALYPFSRVADAPSQRDDDDDDDEEAPTPSCRATIHGRVSRSCHFQIARADGDRADAAPTTSDAAAPVGPDGVNAADAYRSLCKRRLIENNARSRAVLPVGPSEVNARRAHAVLSANTGFGAAVRSHGESLIEARDAAAAARRRRLPGAAAAAASESGGGVRSVIFRLFSVQPFWTVKDLKNTSRFAEKEIKPVLGELCVFHKKGDHRNLWELKKEYQGVAGVAGDGVGGVGGDATLGSPGSDSALPGGVVK